MMRSAVCASGVRFSRSLFTGKERDAESGNDYLGARYYGSNMGRMLSPDPVGGSLANPQSLNKYVYVLNNPLSLTDPTGLYACADDAKGATDHCTSDADQRFEAARQHDLKLGGDAARAAAAYGDPGKEVVNDRGDKVTVGFAPGSKNGEGGVTTLVLNANDKGQPISNSTVTIDSNARDTALNADVGHEGSHVADAQDVAGSSSFTATGGLQVGDNISQYTSEQRAYRVTDSIYRSANEPYNGCGDPKCALGAQSLPIGISGRIDAILHANPQLYHGLSPKNPGGNLLNVDPKLITVPH